MNGIEFFSDSNYLYIPTSKNPKVVIALNNKKIAKNSFKLYNPFSKKAKIVKVICSFLFYSFQ